MKTLIAVPCMDMAPVDFMCSLINLRKTEDTRYAVKQNSLIYDSRNTFASKAITGGYDRIMWFDSDMVFAPDTLERLSKDMDEGRDFVCGICFKRHYPTAPVVYKHLTYQTGTEIRAKAEAYTDYPQNSIFEVEAAGFGCVLMKVDLLRRIWDTFGPPFDPLTQMGEDLSCCWRIKKLGVPMYCDSSVKVGHIGQMIFDETMYRGAADGQKV